MDYEGGPFPCIMEPYSTEPVTLIEEVFPQDTNAYDTLFGGRLLSLMDKAGGIACAKFAHREFVTISIDTLTFIAPARQGDLLEVTGRVVYTSSHTACTKVTAYTMSKATWEKKIICEGYFFFVAIDSMMRPIPVPQFTPSNDEEEEEWEKAKRIRDNMLAQKAKRDA
jgi:acyl-CoA hydrolase